MYIKIRTQDMSSSYHDLDKDTERCIVLYHKAPMMMFIFHLIKTIVLTYLYNATRLLRLSLSEYTY